MGDEKDADTLESAPDWSDLRVFLYAAERGSIRAAAKELGISQPTASQRIRTLEGGLGVMLFVRLVNGIVLTDAGRETLEHARAMRHEMAAIERKVRMRDARAEGRVRLATPDGMAGLWIGPRLADFYAHNEGVTLSLDSGIWPNDPMRDEVDLSMQFEPKEQEGFASEVLGFAHYAPFASRDFIVRHGFPKSLEDIAKFPRLHHVAHTRQRETWDPAITRARDPNPIFETNSSFAMVEGVKAGLGMGFIPTWCAPSCPTLVMLTPAPLAILKFWLVYHEDVGKIERVRRTIVWLRDVYAPARNPWFRETFVHPDGFPKT